MASTAPRSATLPAGCLMVLTVIGVVIVVSGIWSFALGHDAAWLSGMRTFGILVLLAGVGLIVLTVIITRRRAD